MKNLLLRIAVLLVGAAVVVPLMASSAEPTTGQYKVDKDRICVTGLSMGGYGTWSLASFSPDRFTALVPPFTEAAWYTGRHSDDNYLPHFACKAVDDVMRKIMEANPKPRLLVLCGHTHGSGEVQITQNLQVLTGGAEYGNPVIQRIFDIG